jgi:predicted nuclease of predicted toxin-antitoxin system
MIKFLANENVPKATIEKLRNEGFDIISVSSDFPSIKDEAVILFATMDNRVIITFDRDYGELIFKRNIQPPSGIIYFRIQGFQPEEPAEILLNWLSVPNLQFEGFFTVISEKNIRQRKL